MPGVCLCHKEIDRFPSSSTAPKSEILGGKGFLSGTVLFGHGGWVKALEITPL